MVKIILAYGYKNRAVYLGMLWFMISLFLKLNTFSNICGTLLSEDHKYNFWLLFSLRENSGYQKIFKLYLSVYT